MVNPISKEHRAVHGRGNEEEDDEHATQKEVETPVLERDNGDRPVKQQIDPRHTVEARRLLRLFRHCSCTRV